MASPVISDESAWAPSMPEPSALPAFFRRIAATEGEFTVYDDGYRGWSWSYAEVARMVEALRRRFRAEGVGTGDAVMIWSESRPGWVAALWACLLEGLVLVPVEPQSSRALFERIRERVRPKLILRGERVPEADGGVPEWGLKEVERAPAVGPVDPVPLFADDVAEVVFTSGTTAEPKGVVITHRNLAANLPAIEEQFAPYRKYVRPFAPIRIVNLLPLSHLFGQALATFVPPLIPAGVVFLASASPEEISRQMRKRRAAILVAVPKVLEVLRRFVIHHCPEAEEAERVADSAWPLRWRRFRAAHRLFGWKFVCVVSGGAPLPADLEQFWRGLGYVVVQGYGLTETAPIISFSHPFHVRHGTVGRPLAGVEVRLAEDGEILVRGDTVSPGYFRSPEETSAAYHEGWLHTGDIGEFAEGGHLVIKGRKKEMIVTPEGLNVFPDDVEGVLRKIAGVKDAAVVGRDRVHAVLVLEAGTEAAGVVKQANERLEEHQKIRAYSVWRGGELPRTGATGKLRRGEIAEAVRAAGVSEGARRGGVVELVRRFAPGREIGADTTLDELGLSSLDRVELVMDLEEKLGRHIEERSFALVKTVGELEGPLPEAEADDFPEWNRSKWARMARRVALGGVLLPVSKLLGRPFRVSGLEKLDLVSGPVIFASNHQSHLDTAVILASLPARRRYRLAVAMWKEYFEARFHPELHTREERWKTGALYWLLVLLFNAFPIPQTESGTLATVRYMGELVEEGWSILIFPEGERTLTGEISRFLPGVGMLASRLGCPVVPVCLRGAGEVWPRTERRPRWGRMLGGGAGVEVRFGAPVRVERESYAEIAAMVEDAVRRLA